MFTTPARLRALIVPIFAPILAIVMLGMWVNAASASGVPLNAALTPQADFSCNSVSEISETECSTLVTLYNEMDQNGILGERGWLTTDTPCDWHGITCEDGSVTELSLRFVQLGGDIPTELENLSNLVKLEIVFNDQLRTTIPSSLGNLNQLKYLHLQGNQLFGPIPPTLGNLSNLDQLWLYGNQLIGEIPAEIGNLTSLTYLRIHGNQLTGALPSELGQLSNLERLWISHNIGLSGPLPNSLMNLTNLDYLYYFDTALCIPQNEEFQTWFTGIKSVLDNETICVAPEVEAPEIELPEVEESEVEEPAVEEPAVEVPEIEAPEVEAPEIEPSETEPPAVEEPGDDGDNIGEETTPPDGTDTDSADTSDVGDDDNAEGEQGVEEGDNAPEEDLPPPGGIGELDEAKVIFLPFISN